MTAEAFAERLGGVLRNGQWSCQCPAHADKSPSLNVKQADDRIFLHCKAGCTWQEILGAMGLETQDMFDGDPPAPEDRVWYKLKHKHDKERKAEMFWEASGYLEEE
jgi:hypothetical protein